MDRNNIPLTDTVKKQVLLVPQKVLSGNYEKYKPNKKSH